VKKRVKNFNLRLTREQTVTLAVPQRCTVQRADEFIREKSRWITETLERFRADQADDILPMPSRDQCAVVLRQALERVYPLAQPLGVVMPTLKLRKMRSQWGNCHWTQGYITLNTALARCPEELREYVALHELVHFLHHDHGSGFYREMDALMPDWRRRRKELQRYGGALEGT
jgi:predicted metal-dependent hydrolase